MAGKDFQSRPPGDDPLLPLDAAPLVPPVAASPPGCEAGPPGVSGPPPLLMSPLVPDDGDVLHAASRRTRGRTHRMGRTVLQTGHPSRLGPEFGRRGGRARTSPRIQAPVPQRENRRSNAGRQHPLERRGHLRKSGHAPTGSGDRRRACRASPISAAAEIAARRSAAPCSRELLERAAGVGAPAPNTRGERTTCTVQ